MSYRIQLLITLFISCVFSLTSFGQELTTPQSNTHLLPQNQFQYGDINLTQGTVEFSETDLSLPGINGLNLVISRKYNSKHYLSSPVSKLTGSKTFGPGFGHGWSLNIIQRAFIVQASDESKSKVIIEVAGQAHIFNWDNQSHSYVSKTPGNTAQVDVLTDGINYISPTNVTYTFKHSFFTETHKEDTSTHLQVKGYYLSTISDSFSNTISFQYTPTPEVTTQMWTTAKDHEKKGIGRIIGNESYTWLETSFSSIQSQSDHEFYELTKIVDTMSRTILFNWDGSKLSKISYNDDSQTNSTIAYTYNGNGTLKSVYVNNTKKYDYSYDLYTMNYKHYELKYQNSYHPYISKHLSAYPDTNFNSFSELSESFNMINSAENLISLNGDILTKKTTLQEATTRYSYEESLETMRKGEWEPFEGSDTNKAYYTYNYATYPVVIKKEVSNGALRTQREIEALNTAIQDGVMIRIRDFFSKDSFLDTKQHYTFTFNYPKNNNRLHNTKARYTPEYLDEDIKLFYYENVTVKSDLNGEKFVEDTQYNFKNGLLANKQTGKFKTIQDWDYTLNLQKSTETYINSTKKNKVQLTYDTNRNIIKKQLYEANNSTPYLTEEYNYYDAEEFENPAFTYFLRWKSIEDTHGKRRDKSFEYTSKGKLKTTLHYSDNGTAKTHHNYDENGRLIKTTSTGGPAGKTTSEITYEINQDGYLIKQHHNSKVTSQLFSKKTGRKLKATDANGNSTHYTYDKNGMIQFINYPNSSQVQYNYNSDYSYIKKTIGNFSTEIQKDNFGRVIYINRPLGLADTGYNYYYADKVKSVFERDQDGAWTPLNTTQYDSYLRTTEITDPLWGTTKTTYDDDTNSVSVFDILNRETQSVSNQKGQLESTTRYTKDPTLTYTHKYQYNSFGEQIVLTDPKTNKHQVLYDTYGKTKEIYYISEDSTKKKHQTFDYYTNGLTKEVQFYDKLGNKKTKFNYDYDISNRLTKIKHNNITKEWFTYDETSATNGKNKLTTAENLHTKTHYNYDSMSRLKSETTHIKPLNKSYTIYKNYTQDNQLDSISFPDQKKISYTYNDLGQITAIYYNAIKVISYNYDPADGKKTGLQLGNNLEITYTYNAKDLITNAQTTKSGTPVYTESFSYDSLGNIITHTHTNPLTNTPISNQISYSANDELAKIKTNRPNKQDTNFSYDKLGNPITFTKAERRGQVIVNSNSTIENELINQLYTDGRKIEFSYDEQGQLIQKNKFKNNQIVRADSYSYNYQGQLETIKRNNSHLATYYYNHKKERVYSKTTTHTGEEIEKWYYNDGLGNIIGEGSSTTDYEVRYIYNGNEKIAMIRPDSNGTEHIYYFINNLQGTPTLITDATGTIVSRIHLDAWGNMDGFQIASRQEINYTGKKYDTYTGLYYFNQRFYDPEQGKFLTHDPAMQTLNPYLYAGNNPLMYVDPDGEFFIAAVIAAAKWAASNAVIVGAVKGAAASAAISTTSQWVANDFNSSKINWDSVGQAAIGGAVGGALGSGGGIFQTGSEAGLLKTVGVNIGNQVIEGAATALVTGQNYHLTEFGNDIGIGTLQGLHFHRNNLNKDLPGNLVIANESGYVDGGPSSLHGRETKKMIEKKRFFSKEGIYGGIKNLLVTNRGKMGTFNYINPMKWGGVSKSLQWVGQNIGHGAVDIAPWVMWGNTRETTFLSAF